MPNTDPRYKAFLENFKKGLAAEAGNDYSAVNDSIPGKDRQAIGRYQFVPKYHWEEIKKTAKKNGFGDLKSYDDFKNNPALQDVYFETYVQKSVWPKVQKNANNLRDLSMDEYAYYLHFEPESADKYIATGKHREKTKYNPSGQTVLSRYRKARTQQGGTPGYGYDDKKIKEEYDKFNKQLLQIEKNPNKFSDEILAKQKLDLQIDYQKRGLIEPFNALIQVENSTIEKEAKGKYDQDMKDLEFMRGLISEQQIDYIDVNGKQKIEDRKMIYTPKGNVPGAKEFIKRHPNIFKTSSGKGINSRMAVDTKALLGYYQAKANKYLPENEQITIIDKDGFRGKDFNVDVSLSSRLTYKKDAYYGYGTVQDKPYSIENIKKPLKPLFVPVPLPEETEEETTTTTTDNVNTPPVDGNGNSSVNPADITEEEIKKRQSEPAQEYPTTFFEQEMNVPEVPSQAKFKDSFPYADVLGGAVGAIVGLDMAKERIPMRDEQVSDSFRNYAAELSKLSQMGLRPEEEADAKRKITESYQGSITQLTNASGGNRNLVLGNMGRIDSEKQRGLIELALGDAAVKNEALHKYGAAMQYINEFDANRDIANNERKYLAALKTKEAGAALASASFSAMLDSIDNYKENAPGSANHMYKSYMYKELFGFDPQIKDDGTGNILNSFSRYKKQQEELASGAKEYNAYREKFYSLDPEKKIQVTKFMENNLNKKDYFGFIDYVAENNPEGKFDSSNYSEALKSNDFSKMFKMGDEDFTAPNERTFQDGLVNLTPEQLADDKPMTFSQEEKENVIPENGYTGLKAVMGNQDYLSIDAIKEKEKNGISLSESESIFAQTYGEMKPVMENNFGTNDNPVQKLENANSEFDQYMAGEDERKKKNLEQIQKQKDYQKQLEALTGKTY